jgi:hypothetical protein
MDRGYIPAEIDTTGFQWSTSETDMNKMEQKTYSLPPNTFSDRINDFDVSPYTVSACPPGRGNLNTGCARGTKDHNIEIRSPIIATSR